ncbi:MAG: LysR family transcriptional regulator [Alphaproteobacteria bacterium]|nr:LysR family transcriptional regulator [Alphaproteobacteria bacterium]
MNLRFLETFFWLARLKSFTATAARLNTTQPAVSGRIRALERELGMRLLFRTTREVHLTPEGLGILRHVESILDAARLIHESGSSEDTPTGIVRVGAVDAIVRTWLPRLLELIRDRHPQLTVEVIVDTTLQLARGLHQGDLHLVVAIEPVRGDHLASLELCAYAMGWVASPRLVNRRKVHGVEDLARLPLITYPRHSPPERLIADYFAGTDLSRSRISASNSMSTMIRLAADGLGIAAVPPVCVLEEIRAGALCPVRTAKPFPPLPFYGSYRAEPRNRAVAAVLAGCREAVAAFRAERDPRARWTGA